MFNSRNVCLKYEPEDVTSAAVKDENILTGFQLANCVCWMAKAEVPIL